MTKATPRTVQTPGAEPPNRGFDAEAEDHDGGTSERPSAGTTGDELPPDVQAVIAREVAAQVKTLRRTEAEAKRNPANTGPLPTQEEALAKVKADPKRRSILSKDGWVTVPAPVKERDENGFVKA